MPRDNVTEDATEGKRDKFNDPEFWQEQINTAEQNEFRGDWEKAGDAVQALLSRRMGKNVNQHDDPMDYTTSLAWAVVGELIYREPEPTCKAWRVDKESLVPTWKQLLQYTLRKRTRMNQVNALSYLAKGLGAVKILPAGPVPQIYRVDAKNLLFDNRFMKSGGEVFEDSLFIIEKIEKRCSDIRRNTAYDKTTREYVANHEATVQQLPEELAITTVYEIHAKRANGKWSVCTWHREAKRHLLQKIKREPIPTPPYAIMNQPGLRGLETGPLARITNLDEETNKTYKRGLSRTGQRSDVLAVDATKLNKGNNPPGKGNKKSGSERAFQAGKNGVAMLDVNGDPKSAIAHYIIGQMTRDDMLELDYQRSNMQWMLGASPQGISGQGAGEKTATEVNFIDLMRRQRAGVTELLVDAYFDRQAYVMALWLKYMVDNSDRTPRYLDLFTHAITDEEQYGMFMAMAPTFTEDLSEFEFGIETGSTRQMKDRFMIEAFDRILTMAAPLQKVAAAGGERLLLAELLRPFFQALDLPINVEKLFAPLEIQPNIEEEGGEGGDNDELGGNPDEQVAALLASLQAEGGAGNV